MHFLGVLGLANLTGIFCGHSSEQANTSTPSLYCKAGNILQDSYDTFKEYAPETVLANPWAVGAIVVGATVVAAPGLVVVPLLGGAGFSAGGVVAGSAAAAVHGSIGNVAASSVFAVLQSAGAGGYGFAAANLAAQAAGSAAVVSGAAALASDKSKSEHENMGLAVSTV